MKRTAVAAGLVIAAAFVTAAWSMDMDHGKTKSSMFMGYLADVKCATSPNGVSADGATLATNPEKHSAACMKMPQCEASGYGIFIEQKGKYTFYKFDKKGNDLAKSYLKKYKKKDGVYVDVMGTMSHNVITVETISEAYVGMKM